MSRISPLHLVAVAVGAVVGSAVGLLLAPTSGEETRARLARHLDEGSDSLLRRGERALGSVADYLDRRLA